MKKALILFIGIVVVMSTSCDRQANDPNKRIAKLEEELFSEEMIFDEEGKAMAMELVQLYTDYAGAHPEDSLAPEYLFKAGDIAMNFENPGKAISIYNKIIYSYPDFRKTPESLFLVAYIYENQLMNYGKATELYSTFIERYPDNEFADDAQMSIRNMGKSPEELIREFEAMNNDSIQAN